MSKSCYVCNEDPIPIMKYVNFNEKGPVRTYEVLLGCTKKHITPYVIKADDQKNLLIEQNDSILGVFKGFEKKYPKIVNFFKKDNKCSSVYDNIKRSIIIDDVLASGINLRYLMEIHQKIKFYQIIVNPGDKSFEKSWSNRKGGIFYDILCNDERTEKDLSPWYAKTSPDDKAFFKKIKPNIKELKNIYSELSSQLHFFDEDRVTRERKKMWSINDYRDNFGSFLKIANEIESKRGV